MSFLYRRSSCWYSTWFAPCVSCCFACASCYTLRIPLSVYPMTSSLGSYTIILILHLQEPTPLLQLDERRLARHLGTGVTLHHHLSAATPRAVVLTGETNVTSLEIVADNNEGLLNIPWCEPAEAREAERGGAACGNAVLRQSINLFAPVVIARRFLLTG